MSHDLTARQREVLEAAAHGEPVKTTAARLFLSVDTIKWHREAVLHKFGVATMGAAVWRALELGVLDPPTRISADA